MNEFAAVTFFSLLRHDGIDAVKRIWIGVSFEER